MKRIVGGVVFVLSALPAAQAADIPLVTKAPTPLYTNWTGLYAGVHIGGAWADKDWVDPPATGIGGHTADGFIFGGQIGYNFQGGPWVAGVEADVSWSDLNGRHVSPFNADLRTKVEGLGSFTGRLGYSWAQSLVYGKAGVGWARDKHQDFFAGALLGQASDTRWGYTLGVGWEQALTPNLSAKLEYNYLDLGTERLTFSGGTLAPFPLDIDQQIHSLKVGVNYRFGPWPLPTR